MPEKFSRLEPVELREVWPDEAQDFTPWLAQEKNLILLGETLDLKLELEAQEKNVGRFRADILCQNPENPENEMRVLIENQLDETDHKHLGQILTYAAGLDAHTVIWIAKKFKDEHRAALDRLNEITDERFRYFGVEIKVWQIGNSDRAPQFDIVSSPNDWSRAVSQGTQRIENEDLSKTQLLQKKFWTELRGHMTEKGSQLQFRKPRPSCYLNFGIGRSKFGMRAWQGTQDKSISVSIYIKGQNAEPHFHLLKEQLEKIENELGEPLEWSEQSGREVRRVSLLKNNTDPTDKADWANQHEWFASKLELFDKVFRPRIKTLNADDWEPPEDEDDE